MMTLEFPGNLCTNTYILQDYTEIAYIVCSAAGPTNVSDQLQDAVPDRSSLERLKGAERQFRQASILTILDSEKLELFTFYKRVDVTEDRKVMLTRFSTVCKQYSCAMTSKHALRVIDLLIPDNARIFRLFAAAILSSISLQTPGDQKAIRVNQEVWLVQSNESLIEDWSPATRSCARWRLEKTDLQVIASGQLVLAIRPALWPPLYAMPDLIDPDIWPLDSSRGTTLFLLPTGQLARYHGTWITGINLKRGLNHDSDDQRETVEYQQKWIERVTKWLEPRSPMKPDSGTIWLEIEMPVLRNDDQESRSPSLEWKKIYWPAALSYAFEQSVEEYSAKELAIHDPFLAAIQWFSTGAVEAQSSRLSDHTFFNPAFDADENHLFDDDTQFDSPQNFMSVPMQTFAQSQMIYPTPPEGFNTQPTPGMSVDGMVQTPAAISQTIGSNINSSPVAAMAHEIHVPATAQAVANFLNHDADHADDLFDDMDDDKLRHGSFDHEPNWDFFNTEGLNSDQKSKLTEQGADEIKIVTTEEDNTLHLPHTKSYSPGASPKHVSEVTELAQPLDIEQDKDSGTTPLGSDVNLQIAPENTVIEEDLASSVGKDVEELPQPSIDSSTNKRRRSSVYEVTLPPETQRDLRYSKDGKYWFEPRKPFLDKSRAPPPVPLYKPASPRSDASDSSEISTEDEQIEHVPLKPHPWIEYAPIAPIQESEGILKEDQVVVEKDPSIEALIEVITSATGCEPFITPMPLSSSRKIISHTNPEYMSLTLQTLAEQIASSTLFRDHAQLAFPRNCQMSATEASIDSAGSSITLPNAPLGNLNMSTLQQPQSRITRLHSLPHGKVCLNQADNTIAADLSILNFWETLNLQPLSGAKKVQALCIYPKSDAFLRGARLFLQRMAETWVSSNLGDQQPATLKDLTEDGLIAWNVDSDLMQLCRDVGVALGKADIEICTVVYLVIPRDDLRECVQLCHCFQELFHAMAEHRTFDSGDIVLQLVTSSLLMEVGTIAVPPEDQLVALALELYQRLPPTEFVDGLFLAPAITLNESISYGPTFELNTNYISPLARHGQGCHIAYSVSLDNRWLVASWSDGLGEMATSVAYCLLDDEGYLAHSRADIFQHICQISAAMMNRHKQKWWLIIAKLGFFDGEELQDWASATNQMNKDQKLLSRVALVTIELQPRLTLRNTAITKALPLGSQTQNTLNTPVTTPQAVNMTSPEQTTPMTPSGIPMTGFNAPTPPEYNPELSNEADVHIFDAMEDCWAIILPFGFNQSHDFLEVRPALASGFLAKRASGQQTSDQTLSLLGVNLVFVPRKPPSSAPLTQAEREQMLEEIITQYRGLHLLALAKRTIDVQDSPIPCHIASAYRITSFLQQFV